MPFLYIENKYPPSEYLWLTYLLAGREQVRVWWENIDTNLWPEIEAVRLSNDSTSEVRKYQ